MKKYFSLFLFSVLLLAACVRDDGGFDNIDFSGPCQEPVTKVNIKTIDAYSQKPVANQRFKLKVWEIFSSSRVMREVVTSDSGRVNFSFEQDSKNYFNTYLVEQVVDSSDYIALSIPPLSVGCSNDLGILMKKAGVLLLSLKNESAVSHGKCQLSVSAGVSSHLIAIDTFPIGYSQIFQVVKLPEERIWLGLYAQRTSFSQRDTLLANASLTESYTMVIR